MPIDNHTGKRSGNACKCVREYPRFFQFSFAFPNHFRCSLPKHGLYLDRIICGLQGNRTIHTLSHTLQQRSGRTRAYSQSERTFFIGLFGDYSLDRKSKRMFGYYWFLSSDPNSFYLVLHTYFLSLLRYVKLHIYMIKFNNKAKEKFM